MLLETVWPTIALIRRAMWIAKELATFEAKDLRSRLGERWPFFPIEPKLRSRSFRLPCRSKRSRHPVVAALTIAIFLQDFKSVLDRLTADEFVVEKVAEGTKKGAKPSDPWRNPSVDADA